MEILIIIAVVFLPPIITHIYFEVKAVKSPENKEGK